jgi:manganese efflux pump family protein
MGWLSLLATSFALAMDAFAVAIVTGLILVPLTKRHIFRLSFHFGLFQALMPCLGWTAGRIVYRYIASFDHWVAFALLVLVGGRMILTSMRAAEETRTAKDPTTGWDLVMLSVATSIDALAVGLSLAVIGSRIAIPALIIGVVAGCMTVVGMVLGRRIGAAWGRRVELLGGLILIGIGLKILIQHLLATPGP